MLTNYIKIAWRNLLKHKTFSLVNIVGLAMGIAACMIIFIYARHEFTFDQYNKNADRIARVTATIHGPESDIAMAPTPAILASTLKKDYPEVEEAVRLEKDRQVVRVGNNYFKEEEFYWADQSVFTVFSFAMQDGITDHALDKPNTMAISASIAKKYFGNTSAIGKTMVCNNESRLITAVFKDRPTNSNIKIDALLSHDFSAATAWMDDLAVYTFVLFKNKPDIRRFEKKLVSLSKKSVQPELDKAGATNYKAEFLVESLADVRFSQGKHDDTPKGNRQYNYIFSLLAVFILLIALLNYVNLSTAKATERGKEVGIRKVSGALPFQLIRQFLFESFFLVTIAWLISFLLVYTTIPFLNKLLQTTLTIEWGYAVIFTGFVFVTTLLLAGLYPAFVLSSFKPVKVLKGTWRNNPKDLVLRKIITVTQFAIATALIMGAIVVYKQMGFIEKKDLGYSKDQLINIYLPRDSTYRQEVAAFILALRQRSAIKDVTIGGGMVADGLTFGTTFAEDKGKKREMMCNYFPVDPHFLSVFNVRLLDGRNLTDSILSDKKEGFLVNEAFVKRMGWTSPLGKEMDGWGHKGKVIGVVKNFYYRSLHNIVEPLILVYNDVPTNIATVKTASKNLAVIKDIYKQYFPALPIDYLFFDDIINRQYEKDRISMNLFNYFTILAIVISCLGLYGLVSLLVIHRTKEIGIRKVLGASLPNILMLLSKDFVKLVFAAMLIALPVTGILMYKWLQSYAYHESLAGWMFLLPAILVLLLSLAVISQQVIKTALSNPVKALRTD